MRRNIKILLGLTVIAATAAGITQVASGAKAPQRPNILWITNEDMSPHLGSYGDPQARTPNLDRLASQGVRFTRAFSISGVCAPSRSGIITGMYPSSIGTHHMRMKGVPPSYVKCFPEYLRAAGYYCTNNAKTDYNFDAPVTAWDESSRKAHWRGRAKDQPFFAVFNIGVTHESRIRAEREEFLKLSAALKPEDRHDPAKLQLPPYYPDTPEVRKDWTQYYDLITAMDYRVAEILKELEEDGLADNTIVFYYSDHGVGLPRAKRWLYDSGTHIPLIIRWPGQIKPGTVRDDLVSFIDFGPTMLSLAGVKIPSYIQGQAFLGDQAAEPREYIHGARDRMDETYDIIRAVRDKRYKYLRNFEPGKPYAQYIGYSERTPTMQIMRDHNKFGKLTGPQKIFFLPTKPVEELYDTESDPHEINNLAGSPAHEGVLERMRGELKRWMAETNDLGLIPEHVLAEKRRPGGVWAVTAAPSVAPHGGSFGGPITVELNCTTQGASIAYTTETGEKPAWKLYTEKIKITESATLRTKAIRIGYKESSEVQVAFSVK